MIPAKLGDSYVYELGEPTLRQPSQPVKDVKNASFRRDARRLHDALQAFRNQVGFGRAIAAPQIGVNLRFIALDLGKGPVTMVNPKVVWHSPDRFEMWDDCMSFPSLFARLERTTSLSVDFADGEGRPVSWEKLDVATSELLQHEIDHLDGILAVDRAGSIDRIVTREAFERNRALYTKGLTYVIPPLKRTA